MLVRLRLENFYSFKDSTIEFGEDQNIVVGTNGSGKSNLFKAIKLLKMGLAGGQDSLQRFIMIECGGFDNIFYRGIVKREKNEDEFFALTFTFDKEQLKWADSSWIFKDNVRYEIKVTKVEGSANYFITEKICNETAGMRGQHFIFLDFSGGKGVVNERISEENTEFLKLVNYSDFNPNDLVLSQINDSDRYKALTTLKRILSNIYLYDPIDTSKDSPIRNPSQISTNTFLFNDGSNLGYVLNSFKLRQKDVFKAISKNLFTVNNSVEGIDFDISGGRIEILLQERGLNSAIPINSLSDGTLKFFCLVTILLNSAKPAILCIDEPEVGLHPDMIRIIGRLVANYEGKIIVNTHSDILLNNFDYENLLVFEKDESNATIVKSFTDEEMLYWIENYSLGALWQKGVLGGIR